MIHGAYNVKSKDTSPSLSIRPQKTSFFCGKLKVFYRAKCTPYTYWGQRVVQTVRPFFRIFYRFNIPVGSFHTRRLRTQPSGSRVMCCTDSSVNHLLTDSKLSANDRAVTRNATTYLYPHMPYSPGRYAIHYPTWHSIAVVVICLRAAWSIHFHCQMNTFIFPLHFTSLELFV